MPASKHTLERKPAIPESIVQAHREQRDTIVEEGIDGLALLTPLVGRRRQILLGVLAAALAVGGFSALQPRKYKAEIVVTPVTNSRSSPALSGIAALAGANLQMGYQLTPARMVELLTSRAVLSGVGLSMIGPDQRVLDRAFTSGRKPGDADELTRKMRKFTSVASNKETGTVSIAVRHRDSSLARIVASRVVDSASQIFVRTSRAQAHQLRLAQEARVQNAATQLALAEDRLRDFNFRNRATPAFSTAGMERERLDREIRFAEQVYTQAMTERDGAFARELEATPTVVVQDPLPGQLPEVNKRILLKSTIAAAAAFVLLSVVFLIADLMRRRLSRDDTESQRFRAAIVGSPRLLPRRARPS